MISRPRPHSIISSSSTMLLNLISVSESLLISEYCLGLTTDMYKINLYRNKTKELYTYREKFKRNKRNFRYNYQLKFIRYTFYKHEKYEKITKKK